MRIACRWQESTLGFVPVLAKCAFTMELHARSHAGISNRGAIQTARPCSRSSHGTRHLRAVRRRAARRAALQAIEASGTPRRHCGAVVRERELRAESLSEIVRRELVTACNESDCVSIAPTTQAGVTMSPRAVGTFDFKELMHPAYDRSDAGTLSRITMTKRFKGDLQAQSVLRMLRLVTSVPGSEGYVAIEHVTGTLQGRAGSFFLQHGGTRRHGVGGSTIAVIPDSGTGALKGARGHDDRHPGRRRILLRV